MSIVLLATFGACGPAEPLKSTPAEPTVSLTPTAPAPEVVWSTLGDFFPADGPALPAPLASLTPGQPADAALAVLEAVRHPGGRILKDVLGGHPIARAVLADNPDVGVSLVLDTSGTTLEQVNLKLAGDEALAVLGARWGAPVVVSGPDGALVQRWTRDGAVWAAELQTVGEGGSVLAYRKP